MSLKALHIVFVTASILLAFGFGAWEIHAWQGSGATGELAFGIGSCVVGVALLIYGKYFLNKLKHISYL